MFSTAARARTSTPASPAALCLAAVLTATVQLQHGGISLAQSAEDIITCVRPSLGSFRETKTTDFKPFYYAALPITGIASAGSGLYAYCNLAVGGDNTLVLTVLFGLFVGFRVFDLMSDWGMYSISLKTYHDGEPLRHASLAFSIIGSILLVVDLKTMRERAGHWFGVEDGSESLKKVGYGMLSIVLLEDLPQMIISIKYMLDVVGNGRLISDDPIAITSLVLSGISMLINAYIGIRSLC
eukprot:gene3113-16032_t